MRPPTPRAVLAVVAVAALTVFLAPASFAVAGDSGASGASQAKAERTVASLRKLNQALSRQLAELEARTAALETSAARPAPGPLLAGGDLTGTFPAPSVATATVGSAEIIDGSVQGIDIADGAVAAADIANFVLPEAIPAGALGSNQLGGSVVSAATLGHLGFEPKRTANVVKPGQLAASFAKCDGVTQQRMLSGGWRLRPGGTGSSVMAFSPLFPENGGDPNRDWWIVANNEGTIGVEIVPEAVCLK